MENTAVLNREAGLVDVVLCSHCHGTSTNLDLWLCPTCGTVLGEVTMQLSAHEMLPTLA